MTTIREGWWIPEQPVEVRQRRLPRWILGEIDGQVCYSKGGTEHFYCKVQTFINWMKRTNAQLRTKDSAPATLAQAGLSSPPSIGEEHGV